MVDGAVIRLLEAPLSSPDAALLTAEVQAYYASVYGGPDTSPIDEDEFSPPRGRFFIGYDGVGPVSMGGWRFCTEPVPIDAERPVEVKRMYVASTARRRGLARQMLATIESSAARCGADAVVLETGQPQSAAVAFYRACGYLDVPPFGHYADSPVSVHLGKRLRLTS
ncbi:MAG: GNAT family N-acetyltransferase [Nocardioidaceae bacterium]